MSAGRIVLLVLGILLALTGMGLGAGGAGALVAYGVQGGDDGFLTTPTFEVETPTTAVTAGELELVSTPGHWGLRPTPVGTVALWRN